MHRGRTTAQLCRSRGSTLTFQPTIDVSRIQRRGVAMHPKGRRLKENMILRPHGENHYTNANSNHYANYTITIYHKITTQMDTMNGRIAEIVGQKRRVKIPNIFAGVLQIICGVWDGKSRHTPKKCNSN